jgi:hypothetical protein
VVSQNAPVTMSKPPKSRQHLQLGRALRDAREGAGLTLKEMVPAGPSGKGEWSTGHLSKVERGLEGSSIELVRHYARATKVNRRELEDLFGVLPSQTKTRRLSRPIVRKRPARGIPARRPTISGTWLSEYEYETSNRPNEMQHSGHVLVLRQVGSELKGSSRPQRHGSRLEVQGVVDRDLLFTAYWREWTSRDKIYHGAFQLLIDPVASTMTGLWVGFNRRSAVSTGPWTLRLLDRRTDPKTIRQFDYTDPDDWAGPIDTPPA